MTASRLLSASVTPLTRPTSKRRGGPLRMKLKTMAVLRRSGVTLAALRMVVEMVALWRVASSAVAIVRSPAIQRTLPRRSSLREKTATRSSRTRMSISFLLANQHQTC